MCKHLYLFIFSDKRGISNQHVTFLGTTHKMKKEDQAWNKGHGIGKDSVI